MEFIKQIIVTTSWDDGHPLDLKLANLLNMYNIKGTFYIPLSNRKREVMNAGSIVDLSSQFEIGGHTRSHVNLCKLHEQDLEDEIGMAKYELENQLGRPVKMFCYPNGKHNKIVQQVVAKNGYIGARTTSDFSINCGNNVMEMPTTMQAFPHSQWTRLQHAFMTKNLIGIPSILRFGFSRSWVEIAQRIFNETLACNGIWHLWGHSWEIEKYNLWGDLRTVLEFVAHREGVRYLTNAQVIEEVLFSKK